MRSTRIVFALILVPCCLPPSSPRAAAAGAPVRDQASPSVPWRACLAQPAPWYGTPEARRIAENVLLFQRDHGGWPKNVDMAAPLSDAERAELAGNRGEAGTIDNDATTTQLAFLAKVYQASRAARFRDSFLKGFDYLLAAQYANGGWPQYFPLRSGYHSHVTFNDGAMARVMELLHDASRGTGPYGFVDPSRRARADAAVRKGIDCILKTQVVVRGKRTAWCAQHDAVTLQPAKARSYELPSLSGAESVGVVRFLMRLDPPEPAVIEAVQSAVAWFDRAKLAGIRVEERRDASLPRGRDRVVVKDPAAPPLWGRFYEIETNRPFFCGRDGVKKETLAEIEHERRIGYAWYTDAPAALLDRDYPRWQKQWAPDRSVLSPRAGAR